MAAKVGTGGKSKHMRVIQGGGRAEELGKRSVCAQDLIIGCTIPETRRLKRKGDNRDERHRSGRRNQGCEPSRDL